MNKEGAARLSIQLGALSAAAMAAGLTALILMGAIGGVALGVAPEFTLGLAAPLICPQGTTLDYYAVQRSYHRPGESEPHVECVSADGTRQDALLKAIAVVLGLTFLIAFVPIFLAMAIPGLFGGHLLGNALTKRSRGGP